MKNNLIEIQIEIEEVRERKQKHMSLKKNLKKNLSIDDVERVNSIHNTPMYAYGFEEEQSLQFRTQEEMLEALGTPDELNELKYQQAQMAYMNQLEQERLHQQQYQQQQSHKSSLSLKEKWHKFKSLSV